MSQMDRFPWNKYMLGYFYPKIYLIDYCVQIHSPLGFYGAGQARSSSLFV